MQLVLTLLSVATSENNKFGMGIYNESTTTPGLDQQLAEARTLVGSGGPVLLDFDLLFLSPVQRLWDQFDLFEESHMLIYLIEPNAVIGVLIDQFTRIASIGKYDRTVNTVTGWTAIAAYLYDQRVGLSWHILGSTTTERQCEVNIDLRVVIAPPMALLTGVVTSGCAGAVLVLLVGHTAGVGHQNESSNHERGRKGRENRNLHGRGLMQSKPPNRDPGCSDLGMTNVIFHTAECHWPTRCLQGL